MDEPDIDDSTPAPVRRDWSEWRLPIAIILAALILAAGGIIAVLLLPSESVSAAPTSTATPTPTLTLTDPTLPAGVETPTPESPADPKLAARTEAVSGINVAVSAAGIIQGELNSILTRFEAGVTHDLMLPPLERAVGACNAYQDEYESWSPTTLDLWPEAYVEVQSQLLSTCNVLETDSLDVLLESNGLRLLSSLDPLTAALQSGPFYSEAQLEQAVADRQ